MVNRWSTWPILVDVNRRESHILHGFDFRQLHGYPLASWYQVGRLVQ